MPNYPVLCSKLVNQLGLVNFTYQGETISVFVYVAIDSAAVTIHIPVFIMMMEVTV